MELQPKIEPGSPPQFDPNGHRNMSEALHADVDRLEDAFLPRDGKHKAELGSLQEKFELERLMRLQAEEEFKRAQESYEALLKKVKEHEFYNVKEMRNKNPKLKRKRVDDNDSSNVIAELRNRVAELENEKLESEVANKDNLETIANLRTKLTRKKINECVSVGGTTEKEPQAPLQRVIVDAGKHSLGASDKMGRNNLYRHDNKGHIAGKLNVQMPPRSTNKGKVVARSDPTDKPMEDTPQDPFRFHSIAAEIHFEEVIRGRPLIPESALHYRDSPDGALAPVVAGIEERGWQFMIGKRPGPSNASVVREFYANLGSFTAPSVYVRGREISITPQAIAEMLGVPFYGLLDDTNVYKGEAHLDDTLRDITYPGAEWIMSQGGQTPLRLKVLATHLTLEARAWHRLCNSYIRPTGHHSDLRVDQVVLLHRLVTGKKLCLGSTICFIMSGVNNHSRRIGLPFPHIITELARRADVPLEPHDMINTKIDDITYEILAKSDICLHPNLLEKPSKKARREQAERIIIEDIAAAGRSTHPPQPDIMERLCALEQGQAAMKKELKGHATRMVQESEKRVMKKLERLFDCFKGPSKAKRKRKKAATSESEEESDE